MYGSKATLTQAVCNSGVEDPLLLMLFRDQQNCLHKRVGFDVPTYFNGGGSIEDPNSSDWGGVLDCVGLQYFDGDDETISFLFPSRDKASEALEHFPNSRGLFRALKSGFGLRKKPLECVVAVYSNSGNAIALALAGIS